MDTHQKRYNVESIRKQHPNAYAPWTPEEDAHLLEEYAALCEQSENPGRSVSMIIHHLAKKFSRNPGAIRSRLKKLSEKDDRSNKFKEEKTVPRSQKITITPTFQRALDAIERGDHVFITGRAGTGKSTLLRHFRDTTKARPVVLAPTGVAAVNVGGQTIHSFFGFGPEVTTGHLPKPRKPELYKKLKTIIIDEVSMVRADLLDCVDAFLRVHGPIKKRPFGGVQMVFIGDLYQLPPVVTSDAKAALAQSYATPYFFSATVFDPQQRLISEAHDFRMEMIELEDVFRQRDDAFLAILNRVRNNSVTQEDLDMLNARQAARTGNPERDGIVLATTNAIADTINDEALARLSGKTKTFTGAREGKFERSALPTAERLTLKVGARVMMLTNDREGQWINGTLGTITELRKSDGEDVLDVALETGEEVTVGRHEWDMYAYALDKDTGELVAEPVGSFTQFPVRLAWAVTIHKGQGKTFERVHIDIGRGTFAPGQLYVALSRATTLDGITLERPIAKRHVWTDWNVVKFVTQHQYARAAEEMSIEEKVRMIEGAILKKQRLAMTYLKGRDEKSRRTIIPKKVGEMEYQGKPFLGVRGFCTERNDDRVFRVDRILALEIVMNK